MQQLIISNSFHLVVKDHKESDAMETFHLLEDTSASKESNLEALIPTRYRLILTCTVLQERFKRSQP